MFGSNNDGVSLWQDSAYCRDIADPEIFFPERNVKPREAKLLCAGCPVKADCLEYALLYGLSGVWGGTTDKERKRTPKYRIIDLREDAIESGTFNPMLKAS